MIIQKLLFPKEDVCNEWEMYFHSRMIKKELPVRITKSRCVLTEAEKLSERNGMYSKRYSSDGFVIPEGDVVSFQSYFNAFSIGKWRKYTCIEDLSLHLQLSGRVKVRAFNVIGNTYHEPMPMDNTKDRYYHRKPIRREIEIDVKDVEDGVSIKFLHIDYDGIIYLKIEALEEVTLKGGEYTTETQSINDVSFALCICTYNREEYVKRNIKSIIDNIINNDSSLIHNRIDVFISDNGQTLDETMFDNDRVNLFANKNVGGAGGFTRAMIEAALYGKSDTISHVILMDDDILLDVEVLERNYLFLKFIRAQYVESMIGGEFFDVDRKYLQYEAGATCRGLVLQKYNQDWDLRNANAVSANEVENPLNYNAWPYCCIPISHIRKDNLPLPVFIHYDDIEYGMRNPKGIILLNGLCIWHPNKAYIPSPAVRYYDIRNELICMSDKKNPPTAMEVKKHITYCTIGCLLRYRYNVVDGMMAGLEDYYKGPENFMRNDPIQNHKKIEIYNYEYIGYEDIQLQRVKKSRKEETTAVSFALSALCWLLPSCNYIKVCDIENDGLPFRARSMFQYDESSKKGYITSKSYKEALRILLKYIRVIRMISVRHNKVTREWADRKREYTSLEFWEKYLELK